MVNDAQMKAHVGQPSGGVERKVERALSVWMDIGAGGPLITRSKPLSVYSLIKRRRSAD